MLTSFKELIVWQKAMELAKEIYDISKKLPHEEMYSLNSQMKRSAISIPSNIAEGYGRKTTPDYLRSLYIAYGSTCELETQILLSGDLGYLNKESLSELQRDIGEVERMLKALIKSLENKHLNPRTSESHPPFSLFTKKYKETNAIF